MLGGCAAATQKTPDGTAVAPEKAKVAEFHPTYLGIDTILMDNDMVDFRVAMKGARSGPDVLDYARCAAAQYALIRGAGYARQVRTNVTDKRGVMRADAVYLISAELPPGTKTIDAEATVRDCGKKGIPTV
ncbi:hypothetical protein [Acidimangrovimonas sediminis]|uniref:hypothetical protein n=1 Tax=Acidimangrovimonas sediminis TaxID=2056283 RepID=UPI000C80D282